MAVGAEENCVIQKLQGNSSFVGGFLYGSLRQGFTWHHDQTWSLNPQNMDTSGTVLPGSSLSTTLLHTSSSVLFLTFISLIQWPGQRLNSIVRSQTSTEQQTELLKDTLVTPVQHTQALTLTIWREERSNFWHIPFLFLWHDILELTTCQCNHILLLNQKPEK